MLIIGKEEINELIRKYSGRYAMFIAGIYFLALGITLIVRSGLGTTPISSVNYVVSINTPISLGTATVLINLLLIVGQLWLIGSKGSRREKIEVLMQIPFSLLFGVFIDINMALTSGLIPAAYLYSILILALGVLSQAVGVVLEFLPNVAIMSGEGFVKFFARRFHRDFGRTKIVFDITLVGSAILLSLILSGKVEGIREGTVVAAASTGFIVNLLIPPFKRIFHSVC